MHLRMLYCLMYWKEQRKATSSDNHDTFHCFPLNDEGITRLDTVTAAYNRVIQVGLQEDSVA